MQRGPFTLPRPGVGTSDSRFPLDDRRGSSDGLELHPCVRLRAMELFSFSFSFFFFFFPPPPASKPEHHEDRGPATRRLIPHRLSPTQLFLSQAKEDISHPELLRPSSNQKKTPTTAGRHQRTRIKCRLSEFTPRKT